MSQLIKPDEVHLILDTETTGVNPTEGDRLVEIGIIKMRGFNQIGEAHWLINPNRPIPADATRIHGITDAMVRDAPYFEDICDRLMEFIGDYTLVIHNAEFDTRFLNEELRRCDRPILRNKIKDTLAMARRKFPGSPASLDALARRFSITNLRKTEEDGRHGALIDAKILASIWIELEGGRQASMTFEQMMKVEEEVSPIIEVVRGRRVVRADAEEIAAHAVFLKKEVKNAIWSAA